MLDSCKFTPFGLCVKTELLRKGKTQAWLQSKVTEQTGLFLDDSYIRIDTTLNTDGVKKGTEEIKEELESLDDNTQKASESVGGDLASGFKKLGKAIVAAGVVDMLVDFGKQAIELGSDLEEVQNVVDVTFKTMCDKVNKFAKDAQKAAGLSEKMAKQYVGTFGAMADSFGFAEEEAYEMSTTLTQLVGDVYSHDYRYTSGGVTDVQENKKMVRNGTMDKSYDPASCPEKCPN